MTDWAIIEGPRHELGEEPVWDPPRNRMVWIDVARGEAWSATLNSAGSFNSARMLLSEDAPVSAIRIAPDGAMTYATGLDIVHVNAQGTRTVTGRLGGDPARWQVNGLVVLPSGSILAGTLSRDRSEHGALWLVEENGNTPVIRGVRTANGLAIAPDGRGCWHVDTFARTLTHYDLVDDGRTLRSDGQVVTRFDAVPGRPDGIGTDPKTGQLWVAMWDGHCVVRLGPDGEELERVAVPVARPTCCAVTDGDRPRLIVTTAQSPCRSDLDGRVLVRDVQLDRSRECLSQTRVTPTEEALAHECDNIRC